LLSALMFAMMLAYGAAVTSLGLALATWVRRFSVAVGLSVGVYVLLAAGSVLVLLAVGGYSDSLEGLASVSPWYGVGETTYHISESGGTPPEHVGWKLWWVFAYALAAIILAVATRLTFDRCMGRIEGFERPRRRVRSAAPKAAAKR
jgi:hypothetical protein